MLSCDSDCFSAKNICVLWCNKMDKKTEETKEKHIADIIGEWGNWQRTLFIYSFTFELISALNNMGYSFHAFKIDFWCHDVPDNYQVKFYKICLTTKTFLSE